MSLSSKEKLGGREIQHRRLITPSQSLVEELINLHTPRHVGIVDTGLVDV